MKVFEPLFNVFDDTVATFVSAAVSNAAAYITGPITILGTLTFIGFGLSILWGRTELPFEEFARKSATLAIVIIVGGNVANYNTYVADHLMNLPDDMLLVFSGIAASGLAIDDTASIGKVLDAIGIRAMDGIAAMWQAGGLNAIGYYFAAIMFMVFFLFFAVAAAFCVGLMKFGVGLAVALGPIMMVGLLFAATREFFTKWLSYLLHYSALGALIGGVAGLADIVMAEYLNALAAPGASLDIVALMPSALILLLLGVLFWQLPSMAASITGGIGISMGGTVQRAFGAAWRSTQWAGRMTGRGAGAAGRRLYDAASGDNKVQGKDSGARDASLQRLSDRTSGAHKGGNTVTKSPEDGDKDK